MVTGRPGTGKTTLAEAFLKESDLARVSASRIAASGLEAHDMLRAVAYAFGIDANALDKATLRRRIQQYLLQEKQSGRRALLIIDEAQGLPPASLEELRLLADLQEASEPLLQLFLVGQEPLRDMMCAPEMEQFQQRIIATCHLKPLDLRETRAYIKHRLHQAGWKGDPELSGAALLAIHTWSGGVPRQINKMCNRMLLLGYGKGKHVLDEEDTRTISAELREERLTYDGGYQESTDDVTTTRPLENGTKESFSLAELAVRWDQEDVENSTATVAPAHPPEPPATTRQAQQTSAWRMHSKARTARRKRQRMESSSTPDNSVSAPVTLRHPEEIRLVGLTTERNRWGMGMAFVVITLVSASLIALGSVKLQLKDRLGQGDSPREHQAMIAPFLSTPDQYQENVVNRTPQTGESETSKLLAATPEKSPDDGNQNPGNLNTIPVETSRTSETEEVPSKRASGAAPPFAPSGTSTVPAAEVADDVSEVAVVDTDVDSATTTESNEEPQNRELTDSIDTAVMENKAILATSRPVAPPLSREEKIATLLAQGQQALQQFRLLTPKGENAYDYYQQVLDLDRGNADAREGLARISDRYVTLVKRAKAQQKTRLAKLYISRGLRVEPGNRELLALQDSLRKPPLIPVKTVAAAEPDIISEQQQPTSLFSRIKSLFTWHRTQAADVIERSSTFAEP